MKRRLFLGLVAVFLGTEILFAQQAQYKKDGPALLPDPAVTKGAVRIQSKTTVCKTKWGKDERHVTAAMKKQVYAKYGTAPGEGVCAFKNPYGQEWQTGQGGL
jgi:hypothetical protein